MSSEEDVPADHFHLQYPVGYANSRAIVTALEMGASLADELILEEYTLEDMDPKMLELHLDSCISARIDRIHKEGAEVTLDYNTILSKDLDAGEMKAVQAITEIPSLQHLLIHPLISSFIYVKWRKMEWFFYGNLALISILWITLAACTTLLDRTRALFYPFFILLIISYILVIVRECFQIAVLKGKYFKKISNWFEVLMLALSFCPIFLPNVAGHKQLCALSLLVVVLELAMVVKGHPKSSRYIVMLRTVTFTFFHFFLSYSLLLIAFGLSFYKLFYEKTWKDTEASDESPGFFHGVGITFFNMIVMLTGELNASSFKFETFIHGLLFIAFVLVVPIILLNLLCGLAVYDVDMIRDNAEIIGYKEVVKYIVFTEKYIAAIAELRPYWNFLRKKIFLQPEDLSNRSLFVQPYQRNENTKLLGRRTIRRIKHFLFLNENKRIIQHLETIETNRMEIRGLLATVKELSRRLD